MKKRTKKRTTELTKKQKRVYDYIIKFEKKKGYYPSQSEIKVDLGFNSPHSVTSHLKFIRDKGFLDWDDGKSRTFRVLK